MDEKVITLVTGLAAVLAYFTGYTYLYFYFLTFTITPLEIDLGIQYVLVHAFQAYWFWFVNNLPLITLISILSLLGLLLWRQRRKRYQYPSHDRTGRFMYIAATVGFLVLVCGSYNIAKYSGIQKAQESSRLLPVLQIALKPDSVARSIDDLDEVRHIITTPEMVYALKFSGNGAEFWAIRIPKESISAMRVYSD